MLEPSTIARLKESLDVLEEIVKIAAIVVGAIWSYRLFWKRRQIFPRAHLKITVEQFELQRRKTLVHVGVAVKNTGAVLIRLQKGYANLQLLSPCDKAFNDVVEKRVEPAANDPHELTGPLLSKLRYTPQKPHELEPEEIEYIYFDFVLDHGKYRLLKASVYFSNELDKGREIGWHQQVLIAPLGCQALSQDTSELEGLDDDGKK